MANKFPFNNVLKVKKWEEKLQEIKLKNENQKLYILETEFENLTDKISETYSEIETSNFPMWNVYGLYINYLNNLIKEKKSEIDLQKEIIEKERELLKEKRKTRRVLEMLKDECMNIIKNNLKMKETKTLDEISNIIYNKKREK